MCSCTTAKCAGCTCGCFHTPATRRSYWQGLYAAREVVEAISADYKIRGDFNTYGPYREGRMDMKDSALAAIDALKEKP